MKSNLIFILSPILILVLFAVTASIAFACNPPSGPIDWNYAWCMLQEGLPLPVVPTPVAATLPQGDSPATAREVSDAWQLLEPGANIWYKTTYSDNFRVLEFWLETAMPNTIGLAFYSPDQAQGVSASTKPLGRGTHSKNDPDTIIRWKAGYARPGVWYILLTNNTNAPASYKLNHDQQATGVKNCISYWEYLPNGEYVYWTDCGFHTGPH